MVFRTMHKYFDFFFIGKFKKQFKTFSRKGSEVGM